MQKKYAEGVQVDQQQILLETFGSWQDDRQPEEIVNEIYGTRTISDTARHLK